jgi:hypothetical protein
MRLAIAAAALLLLAGCAPRFPQELPPPFGRPAAAPPNPDRPERCRMAPTGAGTICEPQVIGR